LSERTRCLSLNKAMKQTVPSRQSPFDRPAAPIFVILSGPSGVGKDAVLSRMKELACPLSYVTTLTTRPRRPNERDGIDYGFVSVAKFEGMIKNNELLEYANVYGNWYGVPKAAVKQALARGQDAIVRVDIQGAASIKKLIPQVVSIFLMPPSIEELVVRLKQRRTESDSELALRLKTAEIEIKELPSFDYVIINRGNEIDRAVADVLAIIAAEKCRVLPREISL